MSERAFLRFAGLGALGTVLGAALALRWSAPVALGLLAGAAWSALNFWCLAKALPVWLDGRRSPRRSLVWFIVKFPLLYLLLFVILACPAIAPLGFGVGFLIILAVAAAACVSWRPMLTPVSPHGR